MSNLATYRLGDIATFVNGRAYSMPEMLLDGKYRIVRVGNFTGKDEWYYSDMELDAEKYCESGDLLYKWACTFGPEIWTKEKAIYHYHIWKVVPNGKYIDKVYLYYLLGFMTSKWMKAAHGSTMVHITKEIMENNIVMIPSDINEQRLVVEQLKKIDAKIDNNNAICADLEGMAKLLYDYWFVQFDFPDENGKPYKSSGGKMVWNEELKREIPEGWSVVRLGDYITADRGISYNSTTLEGNGVPMINLASFNVDSTYKASGLKTYSGAYGEDQVLHPYDLVMCNTQQTAIDPAKDIIGKTLLVPDIFDGDIVSSHHVTTIHVADYAFKYYLHAESKTTWFHKYVAGFASGTNILGLDFNGVLNYKMPIPPKEIMSKFANISHSFEARKNEVIRENADLAGLRDFLLPMLMNGQVNVKGA